MDNEKTREDDVNKISKVFKHQRTKTAAIEASNKECSINEKVFIRKKSFLQSANNEFIEETDKNSNTSKSLKTKSLNTMKKNDVQINLSFRDSPLEKNGKYSKNYRKYYKNFEEEKYQEKNTNQEYLKKIKLIQNSKKKCEEQSKLLQKYKSLIEYFLK